MVCGWRGGCKGGGVDGVDALWDYGGWVVGKWEGWKMLDWDIMMMGIVLCYRGGAMCVVCIGLIDLVNNR